MLRPTRMVLLLKSRIGAESVLDQVSVRAEMLADLVGGQNHVGAGEQGQDPMDEEDRPP